MLNVSRLTKNFIDRFAYANNRPRFHRLKVMTVVNMGGDSPKAALSSLGNALGGSRVVHELGIATPSWLQPERAIAKKERAIDAAAKKFYRACLDSSLPPPTAGNAFPGFSLYPDPRSSPSFASLQDTAPRRLGEKDSVSVTHFGIG